MIGIIEQFEKTRIIVLGDWNMDFYRKKKHDRALVRFIKESRLLNISQLFLQKVDYTYELNDNKSKIDHVLVNQKMEKTILQCNVKADSLNTSDHLVVHTTIKGKECFNF